MSNFTAIRVRKGVKSVTFGIVINFFLSVIKGLAGFFGHSQALIADAVESGSDVFVSAVTLIGIKASALEPDSNHPYGHGKAESIAAFIVSFFLIAAAILIAITSAGFIINPHESPQAFTLAVLIVSIIIKEGLFKYVSKQSKEIGSTALKADAWHHRSDAITSFVAMIGISISLIGGPGYESADDWAALVGSAIIGFNGVRILREAFNEIMDASPSGNLINEVILVATNVAQVKGVDKCHIRKMGLEYFVDLHVVVDKNLTVKEGHTIAHNVKRKIREMKPVVHDVLVHIEPDK